MNDPLSVLVTDVVDLTSLTSLQELRDCPREVFGPMLDALDLKVQAPGASISGYNGAGPLARDAATVLDRPAE
jgi:hypothetical protein